MLFVTKYSTISKVLSEVRSIQGITQRCFKHNKNAFSTGLNYYTRTILTKSSDGFYRSLTGKPTNFLKPKSLPQGLSIRHQNISKLDINTNVLNNVILYKYENPNYYWKMQLFVTGQLIGWSLLAFFVYNSSLLDIFTTDIEFEKYFKDNIWRLPVFIFSILVGPFMYLLFYALNARTIKYIILNKGGQTLTLITHHTLKRKSIISNLSVGSVKCTSHRTESGMYVSLKVPERRFYFLIEKTGTFVNPKLFDHVLG